MNLVLRLKPGCKVTVLDGLGWEYEVELTEVSSESALGTLMHKRKAESEAGVNITMLLCLTQREKFEGMLQKCTEVGASVFVPVISSRSLVQSEKEIVSKYERWQKIVREAAEQSHRGKVPELRTPMHFDQAVSDLAIKDFCRLIPWEEEKSLGIRKALTMQNGKDVAVLIGPEGGFSSGEVDIAKRSGFIPVTLGSRILRMETAALVSAALVLYENREMEPRSDQSMR